MFEYCHFGLANANAEVCQRVSASCISWRVSWLDDFPQLIRSGQHESEVKEPSLRLPYALCLMLRSMGGFAALSNSHLASSVMVFGPQTDLCLQKWASAPGFNLRASYVLFLRSNSQKTEVMAATPLAKDLTISHLRPGFDPDHLSRTHRPWSCW